MARLNISLQLVEHGIYAVVHFGPVLVVCGLGPCLKAAIRGIDVRQIVGAVVLNISTERRRISRAVFVGDANRSETIIYGFYRGFNIVLSSPSISQCSLQVEGLT